MFAIMAAAPKQLTPLFRPSVKIKFQESNPKNAGSQAFRRFQGYRVATTIKEAHDLGAKPCELRHDWTLGYMKVEDGEAVEMCEVIPYRKKRKDSVGDIDPKHGPQDSIGDIVPEHKPKDCIDLDPPRMLPLVQASAERVQLGHAHEACVPEVSPKSESSARRHGPGKTKRKLYSIKGKQQRSIHVYMLKCFRGKLSLDRSLKLRIFAAALALLDKLSEALLARMPEHHIMAAALLNCAFGLEGLRDNETHQAAELCCRMRLGVALQKGSAERQTFALYKAQIVQGVCNDRGM